MLVRNDILKAIELLISSLVKVMIDTEWFEVNTQMFGECIYEFH